MKKAVRKRASRALGASSSPKGGRSTPKSQPKKNKKPQRTRTSKSDGRDINPPGSKKPYPRPGRRGLDVDRPVPVYEPGDEFINRSPTSVFDGGVDSAIIQPRRGARAPNEQKLTPPIGKRCMLEHIPKTELHPDSFRYKPLANDPMNRLLLVGCPIDSWDPSRGKGKECRTGMKTHVTFTPRDSRTDNCPDGLEPD